MKTLEQLRFDNSYARLPERFYSRVRPTPRGEPYLVAFNPEAARLLELDDGEAERADCAAIFAGWRLLPGAEPIAAVYAGHQFGVWVPRLGDGRAILLGEALTEAGSRWDLQLKGAGPTPYARMGDGYAVLRSTIREYLCGEAMAGLGIPTTRALCIVGSDAPVYRETVETGATLLRLAPSHVRFGSFEYFAHSGQPEQVRQLADYVIALHFPEQARLPEAERYPAWFAEVVARTARLIAQWQAVGFAHGVMNTDNMSILGLTLDYGPFGFLDAYEPGFICNHSDTFGRYAFNRQPAIAHWNLACLATALLPLIPEAELRAALERFPLLFDEYYLALMRAKLGLTEAREEDAELIGDWLDLLVRGHLDYSNSFRALCRFRLDGEHRELRDRCLDRGAFDAWAARYRARLLAEGSCDRERRARMERVNPKYILRNYLAQVAIERAKEKDFAEIERLRALLAEPFAEHPQMEAYAAEPPEWGRHLEIDCSS
ncbi:MAG TPA: YdiU family protein [Candidatus Competibacteraceae bacterium]|nr:YdiU family protein [Candidatus Competibacteraceae bacterium]